MGDAMLNFCMINGKPYAKNEIARVSWQEYVQFAQNTYVRGKNYTSATKSAQN